MFDLVGNSEVWFSRVVTHLTQDMYKLVPIISLKQLASIIDFTCTFPFTPVREKTNNLGSDQF